MENNSDGLSSYLIENNSIFVKTIYFQILLTAEKQDMNRRHKRSEKQEGSYPRDPVSILELDTLYVNLAVKWSFAWPKSIVPTIPLTLDVTISALLTRLRFQYQSWLRHQKYYARTLTPIAPLRDSQRLRSQFVVIRLLGWRCGGEARRAPGDVGEGMLPSSHVSYGIVDFSLYMWIILTWPSF